MANEIVQLNKYTRDQYNVLVPVTTMQAASSLQKIIVSEVQLDTRQDSTNRGPSKDVYFEKSSGAYAITKVGGMKLAAAANISILDTEPGRTDGCQRCIEMAKATGKPQVCGNCPHVHDVAVTVTIRVPDPSGDFRAMKATKEIDCTIEAAGMKGGMNGQQYRRFLPHRTAVAESKAFMRAIRAALGLAGTYSLEDLKKPFVVARLVPNLDAPEIKQVVAQSYLKSMGMLFDVSTSEVRRLGPVKEVEVVEPFADEAPVADSCGVYPEEPNTWAAPDPIPEERAPRSQRAESSAAGRIICSRCNREITGGTSRKGRNWTPQDVAAYSQRTFGRVLCPTCQEIEKGGQHR